MRSGSVPVTGHGLGVKSSHDAKVFRHSVQDEARHPQVITHADSLTRAHLELPLKGKDEGI
jgi:hypothetical protein